MTKLNEEEAYTQYNNYLDEMRIEDIMSYPTSYILKEVDPIAYDCGFTDFCDAKDIEIEED